MRLENLRLASILLFAVACGGSDDKTGPDGSGTPDADADTDADADADTDADTDTDTEPGCSAAVTAVDPEDGDVLVRSDAVVTLSFDGPADAGAVDIDLGVPGSVDLAGDGLSATFTPDGPLDPETEYTVDATVCGNSFSSTFTTLPDPIDTATVLGNTYGVPWADVVISEPQSGMAIKDLIQIDYVLLQINAIDGMGVADSIATIGVTDDRGAIQPQCDQAVRADADFSSNPFYTFDGTLNLVINPSTGQTADIEDFVMIGRLSEDGTEMQDVVLSGLVDSEDFLPRADCRSVLIQAFQPTCLPCTISSTGECMKVEMSVTSAPALPGLDLAGTCPL